MIQVASTLLPSLLDHARVDLRKNVTPIEYLPNFSESLGIKVFAKRDDTLSLGMGGNKVRQLEYYLGPAMAQGADTILITGAVQSNFVCLCAAACARLGLKSVVQLEERVPNDDNSYKHSGNVLLNKVLGAEIHYFHQGEDEAAADANLDKLADKLRSQGRKPYVIHLGIDHSPIGGLGYAECAVECFLQLQMLNQLPDHVVVPTGSGLTHAGFLAGARAIGWKVSVHGICVRRAAELQRIRIRQRTHEILALLQSSEGCQEQDILVDDSVLAPGYGQLNKAVLEAIRLGARSEGMLLDPVYSGRTVAGLISLTRGGAIKAGQSVLFLHTGGLPALFAYQSALSELL
ncbi:D-cysteine desulfhydrase family protein [Granulosicoccus sp.]|nr:D-cysteine desulfhydrase family protein [Granulosicoccus sp.]MDB4222140.1 D-cysteine desulfhydrase family protein [Granulosicoccus sp.]